MRLAGLTCAAALAAASPAAASQTVVPTVVGTIPVAPLAPDEVLLEIQATGVSRIPGDVAMIFVPIARSAATPAEARAAVAAERDRVVAAARRAGVVAADVQVRQPESPSGAGLVESLMDPLLAAAEDAAPGQAHRAAASVEIRLRDPALLVRLREAVETSETSISGPVYSLSNTELGRRQATAEALRRARGDAEEVAREMGLRLRRIVRVSLVDDGGMTELYRPRTASDGSNMVTSSVTISAAFALGPQR
jgi:hypothetical protein